MDFVWSGYVRLLDNLTVPGNYLSEKMIAGKNKIYHAWLVEKLLWKMVWKKITMFGWIWEYCQIFNNALE